MPYELVSRAQADIFFAVLLVLGLLVAPVGGLMAKRCGKRVWEAAVLWSGPLVLIGLLWRIYNAITDRIGLQTVSNLLVNIVLFVAVGALLGAGWVFVTGQKDTPEWKGNEQP